MDLPQGFDLKAIRVFVMVAETGGMTPAAKQLGLTQSTVSQIVGNLEDALGTPLFDRAVRPLALTAAGTTFYERGRVMLAEAGDLLRSLRAGQSEPLSSLTLAMADSLANAVGPALVAEQRALARRWRIWAGISPDNHAALMNRTVDAVVTTTDELDGIEGLESLPILTEPFVLVLPASYQGPVEPLEAMTDLPFVRYSLRSAIGRQIEGQLNRLRLSVPIGAEFDTAASQLTAVGDGMGWSLSTPLCLLQERGRLERLRVEPMTRGRFSRPIALVARRGDLGTTTEVLAAAIRRILKERCLPELFAALPWLAEDIVWPEEPAAAAQPYS
ncbi:LysR family transcriptional regulator [Pelagibius sp.]|uniref:LysR family transcriptional regulator n=1 Tax=Pelagibius sp. TaxID=1931238 RepID=UPI002603187B|nr:LysR family transcriptional regulator [Pelagibius sp.]